MFKIIIWLFFGFSQLLNAQESCIECHKIESFDTKNHDFACVECHIVPDKRQNYTHNDVVTHPDAPETIAFFCTSCHQKDAHNVAKSPHGTLKNALNMTRTLFGHSDSNVTLATLPMPKNDIHRVEDVVDDMLRRKCLKCHLGSQGSGESGMYRGLNCMACHIEYANNGTYQGSDVTMQGKKPYAKTHQLSQKSPMSACLSCHNKSFVGGDYVGLFPKDHDKSYRAPLTKEGLYPPQIYGSDYHYLTEDVHHQKGMTCVDCHSKEEVMEGKKNTRTCKSCHPKLSKNEAHANYHDKMACSTCHASWQMSHYELSLLRDDTPSYKQWKDLTQQEDEYLANFLRSALKAKNPPNPQMPDWITGEMKEGIWYSGWRLRRWENVFLGNTPEGIIKLLRPLFQYRISYKDKEGKIVLDDVFVNSKNEKMEAFVPYDPHTISKNAKSCEQCHENPLEYKGLVKGNSVESLFTGEVKNGAPLSGDQIIKLHSKRYQTIRAKMFFKQN